MYGTAPLAEVLPEVRRRRHAHRHLAAPAREPSGTSRRTRLESFAEMLRQHGVGTGPDHALRPGAIRPAGRNAVLKRFGGRVIVTGAKNADGATLRDRVKAFVDSLRPHVALAEELGVAIGIENHANSLINEPDSIRYFAEFAPSKHLGIALAPYHLPQQEGLIAQLITDLGEHLVHFQAWQHGRAA